ncbi:MAG: diaminopimelate epimerase [Fervidobacterium sp.]|uniref:diaminopimelate epimerase n=1 Tax=Fervidobacterium sp. TaxID=1871331 RepID=UPI00404A1F20
MFKAYKYTATGNSFVIVDATETNLDDSQKEDVVLKVVEDRDGVIFVEKSDSSYFMDYFNRDGKRASFCGNGSRAFLKFLMEHFGLSGKVSIKTNAGLLVGRAEAEISVQMPQPVFERMLFPEELAGFEGAFITVGVPHIVLNIGAEIWNFDMGIAQELRHKFNANVNLFRVLDSKSFEVRTFERGVERETLSCGSGTTATGYFIKYYLNMDTSIPDKLVARTKGGVLTLSFESDGVYLGGGVVNE